ncbi:cytosine permease [Blastococcus sp. BMG 814]|uniref:Cytosine permease n=1 Tax=Blastococcus carthaginiensis TaxID=3050034 RepID=A0ABT9I8V9_9ACTN|nr:cytosine permease [Blastococcus carthaginiensis]MDP5182011.1 cytosine permease [Blastococcus carthaginiensis]
MSSSTSGRAPGRQATGAAAPGNAGTSDLPTLSSERIWGFWSFTSVNIGLAIATWAFLSGGTLAFFVGAKTAIAASVIGNLVGVALVALTTCIPSAKYGLEQYTALRTVFGGNGSRALVLVLFPLAAAGWNAILAIMFGRAIVNVSNSTLGTDFGPNGAMVIAAALFAILLSWLLLVKGPVSIEWVNKFVAPALVLVTVVMLGAIFTEHSWSELLAAPPLAPFGDPGLDWAIAVELSLGVGFSWWTIMGNLARLTTTQRVAFWPNMIGLFLASVVAGVVGSFAALVLGDADPTVWMVPLGGAVLGVLALVFVGFANVTSMVGQTYSGSLAIRRAGGDPARRLPWPVLAGLLFAPAAVVVFWPGAIYDNYFKFLAWVSLILAPLCAVYFVDFFLLRRRTLDVRAIYEPEGVSRYSFWGGFNPAAFVAVAAGAFTYYQLLDPITFESASMFRYTTASLPAFLVAAVVHYVLTRLVVVPNGRGGYVHQRR